MKTRIRRLTCMGHRGLNPLSKDLQPDLVHVLNEPWSVVVLEVIHTRTRHVVTHGCESLWDQNSPLESMARRHAAELSRLERFSHPERRRATGRERWGFDQEFVVGFVGRLVAEKGLVWLLETWRTASLPDHARPVFIGQGPMEGTIRAAATADARIRLIGPVPFEQVPAALASLDALVRPSLTTRDWCEQFGRVITEAMASGVPVIASDSGAIPEAVGDAGIIVSEGSTAELADALRPVSLDPAIQRNRAEAGLARAQTVFSSAVQAERLRGFWRAVAGAQYRDDTADNARSTSAGKKAVSDPNPLNLLAVVGTTRSGSTLLDMLLGDHPAVFSGGELRTIWEQGYLRGQLCSCGEPIQRCEFWSEVMAKAFGSAGHPDPAPHQVAEWQRTTLRQRHTRRIARSVATDPNLAENPKLRDYRQTLLQLYQAIAAVSGRTWIVDSSKLGSDVALVGPVPALHTRVIHLTRDPRGVVHSWSRGPATSVSPWSVKASQGTGQSTLGWLRLNASAEIALRSFDRGRVSRLRYEDFAADPFVELSRLSTELGVPVNENRIADESVTLALNHLVGGNSVRFRREVTIRPDDQWVSAMPRSTKLLIGVATSPLLLKYGYSLSGPPSRARR